MKLEDIKRLREKLRRLDRESGGMFDSQQECCGLTRAQCHTLLEIGDNGPLSLVDLAGRLGLDASTLSRTIQGLVLLNLVHRQPSKTDRRYVDISLTQEGGRIFERIEALNSDYFSRVMAVLPADKRHTVMESLDLFVEAMNHVRREKIRTVEDSP